MIRFISDIRNITLPMLGAFLAGVAAAFFVGWYCVQSGDQLLWLLALTGAIFGWVIGVLAAPLSPDEKHHFGELAKVISGFITGYVLSKLDPAIGALVGVQPGTARPMVMDRIIAEQILVTLSSFGIALLFVFNARLYWSQSEAALREWIEKQPDPKPTRAEAIQRLVALGRKRTRSDRDLGARSS